MLLIDAFSPIETSFIPDEGDSSKAWFSRDVRWEEFLKNYSYPDGLTSGSEVVLLPRLVGSQHGVKQEFGLSALQEAVTRNELAYLDPLITDSFLRNTPKEAQEFLKQRIVDSEGNIHKIWFPALPKFGAHAYLTLEDGQYVLGCVYAKDKPMIAVGSTAFFAPAAAAD